MIGNRAEYEIMHLLEGKLWWYKILHERVLQQIQARFGENKNIKILDAGCGTGGMLAYLKKYNYSNISGFDISLDAVEFCEEKGIFVNQFDLKEIDKYKPDEKYDVIISNDNFYFLNDEEIIKTLKIFSQRLNNQGAIIINIHAFEIFSGTHDVAVGSNRRFILKDFQEYTDRAGVKILYSTYWSFLLSPLILAVRLWQNFKLKIGLLKDSSIYSDVEYPGDSINNLLYNIVKIEQKFSKKYPFGSSLFMVISNQV